MSTRNTRPGHLRQSSDFLNYLLARLGSNVPVQLNMLYEAGKSNLYLIGLNLWTGKIFEFLYGQAVSPGI